MDTPTLADLMKQYEHRHRRRVAPTDYVMLRLDGKSFHSYTKELKKPYDLDLMAAMDETCRVLCEEIPGVRLGYVESDEISLLVTGFRSIPKSDSNPDGVQRGELWMGGVEAKMLSLSAAIATDTFKDMRTRQMDEANMDDEARARFHRGRALFDSRLWAFPGDAEGRDLVRRYFLWRRRDSVKNSVTMAALDRYSHKAIHGMRTEEKQDRLRADGAAWEDLPLGFRYGRNARKYQRVEPVTYTHRRTGEVLTSEAVRNFWAVGAVEDFDSLFTEDTLPTI